VAINKARGNVRNWNFIDQVILPKGDWKWKTYRNDFSFISAAPRKSGNGSGNGYGGNATGQAKRKPQRHDDKGEKYLRTAAHNKTI